MYPNVNEHKSLHFGNEQDMHMSSETWEKLSMTSIWIYHPSRSNHVFHVLSEVD